MLHYFGTIFGFFFQRTADWGPVHVDSYPTSGISTRHAAHEREKMAMYRWQVTHASPKPYFASRFHYDNNNDNSNNNKIAGAEAEKRPKIFDEFIFFFRNVPFFSRLVRPLSFFMDLFFLFFENFLVLFVRGGIAISEFVRGYPYLRLNVNVTHPRSNLVSAHVRVSFKKAFRNDYYYRCYYILASTVYSVMWERKGLMEMPICIAKKSFFPPVCHLASMFFCGFLFFFFFFYLTWFFFRLNFTLWCCTCYLITSTTHSRSAGVSKHGKESEESKKANDRIDV